MTKDTKDLLNMMVDLLETQANIIERYYLYMDGVGSLDDICSHFNENIDTIKELREKINKGDN